MTKSRLEAFSDGVIAILITIMVLELKVPEGAEWSSLAKLYPTLLSYLLSFVFLGIYWNNHHHMFHAVHRVNGKILWANLHLLFWLSLIPFVTAWLGEHHHDSLPVAAYGAVMLGSGVAYFLLEKAIISDQGPQSKLREAVGNVVKERISILSYISALVLAFYVPQISLALYIFVALMWLIPDARIERKL